MLFSIFSIILRLKNWLIFMKVIRHLQPFEPGMHELSTIMTIQS
jgi:hypothetical protein